MLLALKKKKYINQDLLIKYCNARRKTSPWELILVLLEKGLNVFQLYGIDWSCVVTCASSTPLAFEVLPWCLLSCYPNM